MLDQSFSIENFRKILDYENRKGVYLEGVFFPTVKEVSESIKKLNFNLKHSRRQVSPEDLSEYRKTLNEDLESAEDLKEELLLEEFTKIRNNLLSGKFKFSLIKNDHFGEKPIYTSVKSPENFFALKQIQHNFRKLYKVKQANRFAILSQLKSLLGDGFPKLIIRTDISEFYETIPHDILLQKLNEENLLTFSSKKIIHQILSDYRRLSNSNVGLPRGIGISAYLAELYMRDIDQAIKSLVNVSYYARYVDDIVIIFTPNSGNNNINFYDEIRTIIEDKHQLLLNPDKTKVIDLTVLNTNQNIEYLGYKINFGSGPIGFKLSSKKITRYRRRITSSIADYIHFSKINEKSARKLLIKRIRFLAGNTRLLNNKSNILVGVYYSNNLLTTVNDFGAIDAFFLNELRNLTNPILITRLSKFSFKDGFTKKNFSKFSTGDLTEIFKIWRRI